MESELVRLQSEAGVLKRVLEKNSCAALLICFDYSEVSSFGPSCG